MYLLFSVTTYLAISIIFLQLKLGTILPVIMCSDEMTNIHVAGKLTGTLCA